MNDKKQCMKLMNRTSFCLICCTVKTFTFCDFKILFYYQLRKNNFSKMELKVVSIEPMQHKLSY